MITDKQPWWETTDFSFIRIPKALYQNPYYCNLSNESKQLYGFLLDRASLSWASGEKWRTPEGDPFVIFTLAEIQQRLQCGEKKASQLLKALVKHHLVTLRRPKKDGPYHIVVLPFDQSNLRLDTSQNDSCAAVVTTVPHPSKPRLNNTDMNNTDMNNTDRISLLERQIKIQIEYDILISEFSKNQLDAIVDVMVQAMSSTGRTIPVGGIPTATALVKACLQKVTAMKIQYVFDHMDEQDRPIQSYRAYFLSRLCDPEWVVDAFYEERHRQIYTI